MVLVVGSVGTPLLRYGRAEHSRAIDLLKTNSILLWHTPLDKLLIKHIQLKDGVGPALVRADEVRKGACEEVCLCLGVRHDPAPHSGQWLATHSAPQT